MNEIKENLLKEFEDIEQNAKAFDEFQEFYEDFKDKFFALTSETLKNRDKYCDKKNRCKFSPKEFQELRRKLESKYAKKLQEKAKSLSLLQEKLQKEI